MPAHKLATVGNVADVVLIAAVIDDGAAPLGVSMIKPVMSQSPGVSEMVTRFNAVAVVNVWAVD